MGENDDHSRKQAQDKDRFQVRNSKRKCSQWVTVAPVRQTCATKSAHPWPPPRAKRAAGGGSRSDSCETRRGASNARRRDLVSRQRKTDAKGSHQGRGKPFVTALPRTCPWVPLSPAASP